jgi:hypothetical protein
MSVVGILPDDTDPLVTVMKVEKAPLESYADIGGLHDQVCYLFCLLFIIVFQIDFQIFILFDSLIFHT